MRFPSALALAEHLRDRSSGDLRFWIDSHWPLIIMAAQAVYEQESRAVTPKPKAATKPRAPKAAKTFTLEITSQEGVLGSFLVPVKGWELAYAAKADDKNRYGLRCLAVWSARGLPEAAAWARQTTIPRPAAYLAATNGHRLVVIPLTGEVFQTWDMVTLPFGMPSKIKADEVWSIREDTSEQAPSLSGGILPDASQLYSGFDIPPEAAPTLAKGQMHNAVVYAFAHGELWFSPAPTKDLIAQIPYHKIPGVIVPPEADISFQGPIARPMFASSPLRVWLNRNPLGPCVGVNPEIPAIFVTMPVNQSARKAVDAARTATAYTEPAGAIPGTLRAPGLRVKKAPPKGARKRLLQYLTWGMFGLFRPEKDKPYINAASLFGVNGNAAVAGITSLFIMPEHAAVQEATVDLAVLKGWAKTASPDEPLPVLPEVAPEPSARYFQHLLDLLTENPTRIEPVGAYWSEVEAALSPLSALAKGKKNRGIPQEIMLVRCASGPYLAITDGSALRAVPVELEGGAVSRGMLCAPKFLSWLEKTEPLVALGTGNLVEGFQVGPLVSRPTDDEGPLAGVIQLLDNAHVKDGESEAEVWREAFEWVLATQPKVAKLGVNAALTVHGGVLHGVYVPAVDRYTSIRELTHAEGVQLPAQTFGAVATSPGPYWIGPSLVAALAGFELADVFAVTASHQLTLRAQKAFPHGKRRDIAIIMARSL
jgi:hypothetical protein